MSISSYKMENEKIKASGVQSVDDKLTGTAAENKAVFDRLIINYVKGLFNSVIDELTSSAGAASIGVNDLYGAGCENVGQLLARIKNEVDARAKAADMEAKLAEKSDKSITCEHFKGVEYDKESGTFTFIRENGASISVDTLLEKIAVNFDYDADSQELCITMDDGTVNKVPLSALINEYDFESSDTVSLEVVNGKVKALINAESIKMDHLSGEVGLKIGGYIAEASSYAQSASSSAASADDSARNADSYKGLAYTYAEKASASARDASDAASLAENEKQAASDSASSALSSKKAAEDARKAAEEAAEEAKTARDEAVEIADFDPSLYVKNTDYAELNGKAGIVYLASASYGVQYKDTNRDGIQRLCIYSAKAEHLKAENGGKRSAYLPITPSILDDAIKVGLTTNASTLTDEEKNTIANWFGSCRISTGDYLGVGGEAGIVQFPLEFSPDIVFLICPETEDNDFASFAIFFRLLSGKGTYWHFADGSISRERASNLEFASDTFIAELGDNFDYSMQSKTYYYIAIGREE